MATKAVCNLPKVYPDDNRMMNNYTYLNSMAKANGVNKDLDERTGLERCTTATGQAAVPPPSTIDKSTLNQQTHLGPYYASRSLTNATFLFLLVFVIIILGSLLISSYNEGDYHRQYRGFDSFGNTCGSSDNKAIRGVALSGLDTTDKNFKFTWKSRITNMTETICVHRCPAWNIRTNKDLISHYHIFGVNLCRYGVDPLNFERENNSMFGCPDLSYSHIPPHIALESTCVPMIENSNKVLEAQMDMATVCNVNSPSYIQMLIHDSIVVKHTIVRVVVVGYAISFIFHLLLKKLNMKFMWIYICCCTATCIAGNTVMWMFYYDSNVQLNSKTTEEVIDFDRTKVKLWFIAAWIYTAELLIFISYVLTSKDTIPKVATLLVEATTALSLNRWLLVWTNFCLFCELGIMYGAWLSWVCLTTDYQKRVNDAGYVEFTSIQDLTTRRIAALVICAWLCITVINFREMLISGAVSSWYFLERNSNISFPIVRSFFRVVVYHLGTTAVFTMIMPLHLITAVLKRWELKFISSEDGMSILYMKIHYLLNAVLEKFLKYGNRNIIVIVALHGWSFTKSAEVVLQLLRHQINLVARISCLTTSILWIIKMTVVSITICICYIFFQIHERKMCFNFLPLLFTFTLSYICAASLIGMYRISFDTILMCILEDISLNDGSKKPYYMSPHLMNIMNLEDKITQYKPENCQAKHKMSVVNIESVEQVNPAVDQYIYRCFEGECKGFDSMKGLKPMRKKKRRTTLDTKHSDDSFDEEDDDEEDEGDDSSRGSNDFDEEEDEDDDEDRTDSYYKTNQENSYFDKHSDMPTFGILGNENYPSRSEKKKTNGMSDTRINPGQMKDSTTEDTDSNMGGQEVSSNRKQGKPGGKNKHGYVKKSTRGSNKHSSLKPVSSGPIDAAGYVRDLALQAAAAAESAAWSQSGNCTLDFSTMDGQSKYGRGPITDSSKMARMAMVNSLVNGNNKYGARPLQRGNTNDTTLSYNRAKHPATTVNHPVAPTISRTTATILPAITTKDIAKSTPVDVKPVAKQTTTTAVATSTSITTALQSKLAQIVTSNRTDPHITSHKKPAVLPTATTTAGSTTQFMPTTAPNAKTFISKITNNLPASTTAGATMTGTKQSASTTTTNFPLTSGLTTASTKTPVTTSIPPAVASAGVYTINTKPLLSAYVSNSIVNLDKSPTNATTKSHTTTAITTSPVNLPSTTSPITTFNKDLPSTTATKAAHPQSFTPMIAKTTNQTNPVSTIKPIVPFKTLLGNIKESKDPTIKIQMKKAPDI